MTRPRRTSKKKKSKTRLSNINEMAKNVKLPNRKKSYQLHTQTEMNNALKRVANHIRPGNKAMGAGRSVVKKQSFLKRLGTVLALTTPAIQSAAIEPRHGTYRG